MPLYYECQRCTACCRWPGQVRLTNGEITAMAGFLGFTEHDFIQQFTRLRHDRKGLALQEKGNSECVFLDGRDCRVQPVKPRQCQDFPNRWNFSDFLQFCHAIPSEVGEQEWRRRVAGGTIENGRPG